ncbi:MAG: multidrug effflux MFS transporter [Micromonosporaceae bacterium]|nr:multidrug effflux MFS transporter [Micromonosporaceae bacterium]
MTSRSRALALLTILGALTAVGPLSIDMYLPAFPRIADDFDASAAQVQLSLTACMVGLGGGQLLAGPLSDRWGRRRPVLVGVAAYAVTSVLCALTPSIEALVGLRVVQGLAGSVGVVVGRAVVRDLYSGVAAAKYFSRLTIVFGLAPVAAPLLGALALRVTSWRGIFAVLAAIGVLLFAGVLRLLPETLPEQRRSASGLRQTVRAARIVVADRRYVGFALAQALAFGTLFAYIAGASFVIQDAFGASAQTYALMFGGNALGMVVLSQVNAHLLDRLQPSTLLGAALVTNLAATAGLVLVSGAHSLAALGALLFVAVATVGMVMPNGTSLALEGHPERAGTAAALLGATQSATGGLVAPLVGLAGEGTARPMALVMLSCSVLAMAAFAVAGPARARRASPAPEPVRR